MKNVNGRAITMEEWNERKSPKGVQLQFWKGGKGGAKGRSAHSVGTFGSSGWSATAEKPSLKKLERNLTLATEFADADRIVQRMQKFLDRRKKEMRGFKPELFRKKGSTSQGKKEGEESHSDSNSNTNEIDEEGEVEFIAPHSSSTSEKTSANFKTSTIEVPGNADNKIPHVFADRWYDHDADSFLGVFQNYHYSEYLTKDNTIDGLRKRKARADAHVAEELQRMRRRAGEEDTLSCC
jgi:hypothetical protein